MGSGNNNEQVYDLRSIEDVFACLEIISIARGVLFGIDPELADKMSKVSDALGAFSLLVLEGKLIEPPGAASCQQEVEPCMPNTRQKDDPQGGIFFDLTATRKPTPVSSALGDSPPPVKKKIGTDDSDTGIIDILTGERIK